MPKVIVSKEFQFDYGHRVPTQRFNRVPSASCSSDSETKNWRSLLITDDYVCKHLHGHRGKFIPYFIADREFAYKELEEVGYYIDFKELKFIKDFIDNNLDHRMLIMYNDALAAPYNIIAPILKSFNLPQLRFEILVLGAAETIRIPVDNADLVITLQENLRPVIKTIESDEVLSQLKYYGINIRLRNLPEIEQAVESIQDEISRALLSETLVYLESFVFTNFVPTAENIAHWLGQYIEQYIEYKFASANDKIKLYKIEFYETPKSKVVLEYS